MSKVEERVSEIWEELIVKERLKTIMAKIDKMEDNIINNRIIVKEELTNLWNTSEIPTFKLILEKLTIIQNHLAQEKEEEKIIEEGITDPNVISVNVIGRIKEPILLDIGKSKPRINKEIKKIVKNLADLQKLGKF